MEHNMTDYEETKETFKLQVPEYYNFGFDVVDKWAEDKTKLAAIWANVTGKSIRKYTFWDISRQSNQFANLLLNMGIKKGDIIFVMIPRIPEWFAVIIGGKLGEWVSYDMEMEKCSPYLSLI
jgi:acetyl-CoA synthetase